MCQNARGTWVLRLSVAGTRGSERGWAKEGGHVSGRKPNMWREQLLRSKSRSRKQPRLSSGRATRVQRVRTVREQWTQRRLFPRGETATQFKRLPWHMQNVADQVPRWRQTCPRTCQARQRAVAVEPLGKPVCAPKHVHTRVGQVVKMCNAPSQLICHLTAPRLARGRYYTWHHRSACSSHSRVYPLGVCCSADIDNARVRHCRIEGDFRVPRVCGSDADNPIVYHLWTKEIACACGKKMHAKPWVTQQERSTHVSATCSMELREDS